MNSPLSRACPYNQDTFDPQCRILVDTDVSVDTLKVRLEDYAISDGADFAVERPGEGSCLFETDRGKKVYGTEAFVRGEHWYLRIAPDRLGIPRARLNVSVPKLLYGTNLQGADGEDVQRVVEHVQGALEAIGVRSDLQQALLSRVDVARNVFLEEPFDAYMPVLRCLRPRGNMQPADYPWPGLLWKNRRTEALVVYAKHLEAGLGPSQTIARFEHRLFGVRKVRSVLGAERMSDLIEGYDDLPNLFRQQMHRHLFAVPMISLPNARAITPSSMSAFLQAYRNHDSGPGWMDRALAAFTLSQAIELGVPKDELLDALSSLDSNPPRRRRILSERLTFASGTLTEPLTGKHFGDLYDELRLNVLA